jgi:RNA polymerase sigma-70 factor (ECF subfamily)
MARDIEQILGESARRLIARATEARSLDTSAIFPRLKTTVEKYLLRHQPDAPTSEINEFIDRLHADDLLLVIACERGDENAWADIMERYRATVVSAARAASSAESEAEELAQSVWAELYGLRSSASGQPAGKLAYYSGCGSLGGWLRAVVGQLAVDRHRRSSRLVQTEEASDFDRLAAEGAHDDGWRPQPLPDPESALAEGQAARAVQESLASAMADLSGEDRLLVKLYYFDGLRLKEAGAILGVHEATASRRLTKLHGEIRRRVESMLMSERRWTREETARNLSNVSRMDVGGDLRSVLAAGAGVGEKRDELYE